MKKNGLDVEQDQLLRGPTGTSTSSCQETETKGGSGMSYTMKASPKPSFRAPWRVGIAWLERGNASWTT